MIKYLSVMLCLTLGLSVQANNWTFSRDANTTPRGGTSIGVPVTYDNETPIIITSSLEMRLCLFEAQFFSDPVRKNITKNYYDGAHKD